MPVQLHLLEGGKAPREVDQNFKRLRDHANSLEKTVADLKAQIAATPKPLTLQQIRAGLSVGGVAPLNLTGLPGATVAATPTPAGAPAPIPPNPNPSPSPTPTPGLCYMNIANGQPGGVPAKPNLRWFRGDMCGVEIAGLPAVAGGATNASTVLSWFLDRYSAANQSLILQTHVNRGYTHFLLSWPDSRDGNGQSIAQFVATAQLVQSFRLYPVVFLYSKDFDGKDPSPTKNDALIAAMQAANAIPIASVGWELDAFNTPGPPFQALIDHITGLLVPATNCYVHFNQNIPHWATPGKGGADFWALQVNKLTGILFQSAWADNCGQIQARLNDLQTRFGAGAAGWPTQSGFGHPFDVVGFEYAASLRFNGSMTEAQAQVIGQQVISSPSASGGPPVMAISGFGNSGPNV
jgi:hypothetical protein